MEKYLNTIFRNLRALEENRRVRVSRKCDHLARILKKESSAESSCIEWRKTIPENSLRETEVLKLRAHAGDWC